MEIKTSIQKYWNKIKVWGAKRPKLRFGILTLLSLVVIFIILNWCFPLPAKPGYSLIITDSKDQVMHAYLTKDEQWRMETELEEISPLLKKAIIEKEDKYFYYHIGVNPIAIGRAAIKNILRGRRTSGASTITMQVAKLLQPKKRTWGNKFIEAFRAIQLELTYSKDEILQMYLSMLPYGGNIQGVKSAAWMYFNKDPDHLSLAEIAALSVIPNRPSQLIVGKTNDKIVEYRNKLLQEFLAEKIFTEKEIQDAIEEPFEAKRNTTPRLAPHLSYKLMKSYGVAGKNKIQSTIDLNTQLKSEQLVKDYIRALKFRGVNNAAAVIIDNKTHKVVSYVGSADFYGLEDAGQVNGAKAIRQPGSTLKPFLYALCIDEGIITPKRIITDINVNYSGYSPENFDKQFDGYVTAENALSRSLNIPAVKLLNQYGVKPFIAQLAECDFVQIKKDQNKLGLSTILGGCGTSLEELTALFSVFANDGRYAKPIYIAADSVRMKKNILSKASAFMITEILTKVNRPDFPISWQSTEKMPQIAWKTGTSYGRRDGWSIGYNKSYTIGVWVGNFSGSSIPDLSGAEMATPLLFKLFNSVDYNSMDNWFEQPDDCDIRMVCGETGMIPSSFCTNIVTDYFIPVISDNKYCNNMQEIPISIDGKTSYCVQCKPENGYKTKWFKVISPEMQDYYDERKIPYERIPTHNPNCEVVYKEQGPKITSPSHGADYYISTISPEPIALKCLTAMDVAKVYWYINDKFYKTANTNEKIFFMPDAGPIKISCTDDKGRTKNIRINVHKVNM